VKYTTVFWDWNGTILDDLQTGINCINVLFSRRGMPLFNSPADYFDKFCFPIEEYYRRAGFDYEKEPYVKLAHEYMDEYYKQMLSAPVFSDVAETLKTLNTAGVRQVVLSAYEKEGLKKLLKYHGLLGYFDDVIGLDNIYAASKIETARAWLAVNSVDTRSALMVGDTTHDTEVAAAIGCDCVLIARGHNAKKR
jgi:haloacid dehalogenase superfamily, subfamily IA, variant 1 with third motif having Dx(3-4)D or Dx(3-4)E